MQPHFCPSSGINIYGHFNLGHRADETLAECAAGLEYGSDWIPVCTELHFYISFFLFVIRLV